MKNTLATTALVLAIVGGMIGAASTATAFPTKTKACSKCHGTSAAVVIKLTKKSQTSTNATYAIKVSGGSGATGWAVFSGTKNLKHKTSATGTFTVARGKTYKVWSVKKGSGAASKSLVVK
jgi:hypothetical protein